MYHNVLPYLNGYRCDQDKDECLERPCQNGATCAESNDDGSIAKDTYRCTCAAGYSGFDCDTADPCVATPTITDDGTDGNFYCINGGTIGGTTGTCTCTCTWYPTLC